ncbi:proline/glycine betaine ABC transporter ATP-binding protein [Tepidanaerobacter syntrophicus]|uniref:ABC transporter ATP-binding protein n=1 Tax=Tepidanaerobacter syntrophicus TaxID=224999 RepID=UPI00175EBB3E|nr:ABC transporter ATP-binding protein [Tepidanaerobacter syntrophicus]GLI19888.1 proline/glycine betaine ABC transporter ATP-binding protein [Tepidanaerobacter syntrophicus]GLI51516.1 proline/glycine betaine ABC transporter ATP-binding protein [Tepidanaerobacter syntrophicus]HHV82647.1 betaine/proline/choline family ABC transporter ATP-binding protein [Tepidanaerobacter syntrophicus]
MISFKNVTKKFGEQIAVDNLTIDLPSSEITVLIGPSGCGKTTTLRMINRLIEPTEGVIYINGTDISKVDPVELRRNIGYVIQQIALFPHMTIAQNVGLVPYLKNWPEAKRKERIEELLEMVGMPPSKFYNRYPDELSGGQQQRIGVARALAADPDIILMDEPFGALDPITRTTLQDELLDMQDKLGKTIVFVTHDMDEALKLANKIAIMKDGKVLQYDTPEQLLKNPAHGFVEEFIGRDRLLKRPELIKVKDIMITEPVTILPERTLTQALEKMRREKVDSLMVVDRSEKFIGLVTANDVLQSFDKVEKISEIVKTEVYYVNEDANVSQVLSIMAQKQVGYVPVVSSDNRLVGLVTRSSLVNVLGATANRGKGEDKK